MTNQADNDRELIKRLKEKSAGFKLSDSEKAALKYSLMEQIDLGVVTKTALGRSNWWTYQVNFRGVVMPFLPILVAILLAGGAGTATLANEAKPGDPLYGVDQWMEQLQQRFTNRAEVKAKLYARFTEERIKELEALREVDPSALTDKAKTLWEEHQQEAIDRLAKSIEQVNTLQDKFEEKLSETIDPEQKEVFQKIIEHLDEVREKREDRLDKIEERTFPGLPNLELMKKMQESRREHQKDMQETQREMLKELKEWRLGDNGVRPWENDDSDDRDDDEDRDEDDDRDDDKDSPSISSNSSGVTAQALEARIPRDENGNIDWDLYDTDHDGIPDKWDKDPDWPPHTM